MTLYQQAVQTYIQRLHLQAMFSSIQKHFLRCKMLVGKSQTLVLHRSGAGSAIVLLRKIRMRF